MQLKGPLLRHASCKKPQDTKIARFQAPKPILDDADPNTDMGMMFSSSPLAQPKEYLGSVSSIFDILGRFATTSFVQINVEK
jgi:hypothetical protein